MLRKLKTSRKIELKIYKDKETGTPYLKVRDVAAVLGIKQPFEFTADIKKKHGPDSIKTGYDLPHLLNTDDTKRATYVSFKDLYDFLTINPNWKLRMNQAKKAELITELGQFV